MEKNLKRLLDLINKQENLENEKRFKVASATLVCRIINVNSTKNVTLLQENLQLNQDEFNEMSNNPKDINEEIYYIKDELKNNMFQVMQFLKILNKFAIIDGCEQKTYRQFESIRDKFLKEHY